MKSKILAASATRSLDGDSGKTIERMDICMVSNIPIHAIVARANRFLANGD